MKRWITTFALAVMTAAAMPAQAQLSFGGSLLDHDLMTSGDFSDLSHHGLFGTARFMAMGGAFTSLGGDATSMFQNPAGLGMYSGSEFTLTPLVGTTRGETPGTMAYTGDTRTRFAMSNVSLVLNVFESGSLPLTSLSIGFGMNRVADFNSRYSFSSESRYDPARPDRLMPTIADLFGQQLGQNGIFPASDGALGYNGVSPYFWPAVLGYNGYMISPYTDREGQPVWMADCIGHNASVLHSNEVVSRGSINEFAISAGANLLNIVYVGISAGIQNGRRERTIYYQEEYGYFDAAGAPTAAVDAEGAAVRTQLEYAGIYQRVVEDGRGVNLKLGVIVRPVAQLRLGMAYHTPTWYAIDRIYEGDVESALRNNETGERLVARDRTPKLVDEMDNSWRYATPSRLMFGASYAFGQMALISVDYERDWYNGIRVKHVPGGDPAFMYAPAQYKEEFRQNYRAVNILRVGGELKPLPMLAIRAGYGFSTSAFEEGAQYIGAPHRTESQIYTAGLGLRFSQMVSLDVAYQNVTDKQTAYQLFFSRNAAGDFVTYSGSYETQFTRHFVAVSLGFHF